MVTRPMNVYLEALGCRLNEAELASWRREFACAGHHCVATPQDADVVILNSCAVTREAERKSRKLSSRLHRANPDAHLVLTGCYAELAGEEAHRLPGVDLVIGNGDKEQLVQRITEEVATDAMPSRATAPASAHAFVPTRSRAFVKVQDGCRNRCTFCIVTKARGEERSRSVDALVDEVNGLHRAGYAEVVLTGVHLGGYGSDIGTDLYTLVETLLERTTIPRLRLSSLEPWDLPHHFWQLWRNPRLCPHLHLPLQSGSDVILRRMARRCSATSFAALAESARSEIDDLAITTDIIVGFPGESDADFAATCRFVEQIGFTHVHIFVFSPREGTAAARMSDQLPVADKKSRSRTLHQIASDVRTVQVNRFVGQTRPILWEESETVGAEVRWTGLTDNYIRAELLTSAAVDLRGSITEAQLSGYANGRVQCVPRLPAREVAA